LWLAWTVVAASGARVCPACPACGGDELRQAVPQAFGVLCGQVDLVRPAVNSESDCLGCRGAVDVVGELDDGDACQRVASGSRRCLGCNAGLPLDPSRVAGLCRYAMVCTATRQLSLSAVVYARPTPVVPVVRSVASQKVSGQAGTGWVGSGRLGGGCWLRDAIHLADASAAGDAGPLGEAG